MFLNDSSALNSQKFLVLFSGGQDSCISLIKTIEELMSKLQLNCLPVSKLQNYIKTISFNYGQKHKIELNSARNILNYLSLNYDEINVKGLLRARSSLIDTKKSSVNLNSSLSFSDLPTTFVPGRNLLFLSIAANIAYSFTAKQIVTGVCQTDFSGYYDCREDFIKSITKANNQACFGTDQGFEIMTPLMHLTKAQSVNLLNTKSFGSKFIEFTDGIKLSLEELAIKILAISHTCYKGQKPPCGVCDSCRLRERGFKESYLSFDPLLKA